MKKYEFTGETKTVSFLFEDVTLHRIQAITSFASVVAGELGGWIEKEENLSHKGDAWVSENAAVYGDAVVSGNAWVSGNAVVSENAEVSGNAWVSENAVVSGNAWVSENAVVSENAEVSGNAWVSENAVVSENAEVFSVRHVLVIGPIGSRNAFTTFYHDKDNEITVQCGCFIGKIDKFLEKVAQTYGDSKYAQVYRKAVELAKLQIDL